MEQHAASFIAHTEASSGSEPPRFIKDEFDAFLECGILAQGFLRLRCGERGPDKLLACSRKLRGSCPSCGARRMSQTAAHRVDPVIPRVPVRQWVLSMPIPLRALLAAQPQAGHAGAATGAARGYAPSAGRCRARARRRPRRRGHTDPALRLGCQPQHTSTLPGAGRRLPLRPQQAAAITDRITFGPRAGQKVLTLRGAMPRERTDWPSVAAALTPVTRWVLACTLLALLAITAIPWLAQNFGFLPLTPLQWLGATAAGLAMVPLLHLSKVLLVERTPVRNASV